MELSYIESPVQLFFLKYSSNLGLCARVEIPSRLYHPRYKRDRAQTVDKLQYNVECKLPIS